MKRKRKRFDRRAGVTSFFTLVAVAAQHEAGRQERVRLRRELDTERRKVVDVANRLSFVRPALSAPVARVQLYEDYVNEGRENLVLDLADGTRQTYPISMSHPQRNRWRT